MASIFSGWFTPATPPPVHQHVKPKSSFFSDTIAATGLGAIALVTANALKRTNPELAALLQCTAGGIGLIWLFKRCCGSSSTSQAVPHHNPNQGNWQLPFQGFFGNHWNSQPNHVPAAVQHHVHHVNQAPVTHGQFFQAPMTHASGLSQPHVTHAPGPSFQSQTKPFIQAPATHAPGPFIQPHVTHAPGPSFQAQSQPILAKQNHGSASNDFPHVNPAAAKPGGFPTKFTKT